MTSTPAPPPSARRLGLGRLVLIVAAVCVIPALIDAVRRLTIELFDERPGIRWNHVAFQGSYWIIAGLLTPIVYFMAQRFPLQRRRAGLTILAHLLGAAVLCVVWVVANVLFGRALHLDFMGGSLLH